MWVRFHVRDVATAAHFLGVLVIGVGLAMFVPLLTAVAAREWGPAADYLVSIAACGVIGGLLRLAQVRPAKMTRPDALVIVGLGWLVVSLAGAIPLYLSGQWGSYLDAVFETVSGFTTSGLSLVTDLDHLAHAHNMWRHMTHLLGGQGIIVIALTFAFVGRLGGTASLYQAEGRDEHILPNIMFTSRFIWVVTGVIVGAGTLALLVVNLGNGMSVDRGFLHAFWVTVASYDTGGFAPQSMNTLYYHSPAFEVVTMMTMMAGMLNFAVHAHLWRGNWREMYRNIETRTLLVSISALATLAVLAMAMSPHLNGIDPMFRKGVYHVISAHSGTGHQSIYGAQWQNIVPSGALFAVILAMGFGGAVCSTAGGIKAMRVGLIAKSILLDVRTALAPESAIIRTWFHHIRRRLLTPELAAGAATIFILYVLSYTVGAIVGVAYGYDLEVSLFESVSAAANVGLTAGITEPAMPTGLKLVYILQMWIGRLEFIALLALVAGVLVSLMPRRRVA